MRLIVMTIICVFSSQVRSEGACNEKPVSINIGFDYLNSDLSLEGSSVHDSVLQGHMAEQFSPKDKIRFLSDKDVAAVDGKAKFIANLRSLAASSKVVNLNYAGHSIKLSNGESALLLPNAIQRMQADSLFSQCIHMYLKGYDLSAGGSHLGETCKMTVAPYIVTAQELTSALPNKKIFGIIDTCFAEGFNLGKDSSIIYSSKKDQFSSNGYTSFTDLMAIQIGPDSNEHIMTFGDLSKAAQAGKLVHGKSQTPVAKTHSWSDCYALETSRANQPSLSLDDEVAKIPTAKPGEADAGGAAVH